MTSVFLLFSFVFLLAIVLLQVSDGQFIQLDSFKSAGCAVSTAQGTQFFAVGVCASMNGTSPYLKIAVVTFGSKSLAIFTSYGTSSCTGTGKTTGNYTITPTCSYQEGTFLIVTITTSITVPSNTLGQYRWTSPAACTTGTTTSGLFSAFFSPQPTAATTCNQGNNPSNGPSTYQRAFCPNIITSTSGGFMVINYYTTSGCKRAPVSSQTTQLGVCTTQTTMSNVVSFMYVPWTNSHGITQFNETYWSGVGCTISPQITKQTFVTGYNTTSCKKAIHPPYVQNAPKDGYYTVSLASTAGLTTGFGTAVYSTLAGCLAGIPSTLTYLSVMFSGGSCTPLSMVSGATGATSISLSSCPTMVNTPMILYASTR